MKRDKEDKLFQLELERFKMKSTWESRIFYSFLALIGAVIIFYIHEGKFMENSFWWLLLSFSFIFINWRRIVNKFLDKEKEKIA